MKTPALTPNVHQVFNRLRQKDMPYHHLFHNFTAYTNLEVFQAQAMIDSGTTWNLILQNVVKQHGLVGDNNLPHKLKVLGNFKIQMYQYHNMVIQAQDKYDHQAITVILIIDANFTSCNLILKISWLQAAKPMIKWEDENLTFPEPDGKLPMMTRLKKSLKTKSKCKTQKQL